MDDPVPYMVQNLFYLKRRALTLLQSIADLLPSFVSEYFVHVASIEQR
jgi:hypothetical protein